MEKTNERGWLKKTIGYGVTVVFILMLVMAFLLSFQSMKNPGEPPSIFGFQPLTVLSNSMNPTFHTGDLVVIREVDASTIAVDDIITFSEPNGPFISHRVVEVVSDENGTSFVTKGDNNNVIDEQVVTPQMIQGKSIFHIPKLGYMSKFASGKIGIMLLIILPLCGYFLLSITERLRGVKAEA